MYEHVSVLDQIFPNLIGRGTLEVVETNLSLLATALEQDNPPAHLAEFVEACAEATNTKNNREH